MTKKSSKEPTDPESDLFRKAMSDAEPLQHEPRAESSRQVQPRARFRRSDEHEVLRESLAADIDDTESGSGESLRFQRPQVGRRTMRKLTRGSFSVQSELDLHGMTADEATEALRQFIGDAQLRGHTCVRIVHGKGLGSGYRGPVLKGRVNSLLRRWDAVLAFVSARQVDGGTGAIYVLINK